MEQNNTDRRTLQLDELTVLEELDRICKKHGLRYFLTAGTLLGAVRHKGFIPWDDDIDVAMPREDYDRLAKLCEREGELAEGFFYQSEKTERLHTFFFAKIRKDGTEVTEHLLEGVDIHNGCYVDIFPLDKCPKIPALAKLYFKTIQMLNCAIISKVSADFKDEYKPFTRFVFKCVRLLPFGALRALRRFVRWFYSVFSTGKLWCTVAGSHGFPRESYLPGWFGGEVMLEFEGKEYPAPIGYKELLTNMYGDYMTPPAEDDRGGHFK